MLSRLNRTFLDICLHLVLTVFFALLLYRETSNPLSLVIFAAGGILIDLDHLIDYFLYFKNKFRREYFFGHLYLRSGKVYLFLHSWEWNILVLLFAIKSGSFGLFVLFLALTSHLLIDNVQRKNKLFYFIAYRFAKDFNVDIILPEHKDWLIKDKDSRELFLRPGL